MDLTLSLGISNGGTAKKRKLQGRVVDDVGDRSRVIMRLPHARERMMARLELDDPRMMVSDDDGAGTSIRLMHFLLSSMVAGDAGDAHASASALQEVYRCASFRGGHPAQRVAAYFADALASRLLRSPPAAPAPTHAERFLAYTMFYQASPLYQLAHFTANQAILEAFEADSRRRLHLADSVPIRRRRHKHEQFMRRASSVPADHWLRHERRRAAANRGPAYAVRERLPQPKV
jgi:hypothetical protein